MKITEERMRTVEMLCDQFEEILLGQYDINEGVADVLSFRKVDVADLQARLLACELEQVESDKWAEQVTRLLQEQSITNHEIAAFLNIERVAFWKWNEQALCFTTAHVLKVRT